LENIELDLNKAIEKNDIDKIQHYLKNCPKLEADNLIFKILLEEDFKDWIDLFDSINYHKDLPNSCKMAFRLGFKRFFENADSINELLNYKKEAILDIIYSGNDLHTINNHFGLNIGSYTIKEIEYYNEKFYLGGLSILYTLDDWQKNIDDYIMSKFLHLDVLINIVENSNKIKIKNKILDF
tara:strand:- start:7945 stop:8490 length:546 start_codon:yes stop_codon:yes gene_type:complete